LSIFAPLDEGRKSRLLWQWLGDFNIFIVNFDFRVRVRHPSEEDFCRVSHSAALILFGETPACRSAQTRDCYFAGPVT
jgi:hypothetical protein